MKTKNKNGKNKIKETIRRKNFLNNKKHRKGIDDNISRNKTFSKNDSDIKNNNINEEIYEIPGYFYDKEKKRYFLLNQTVPLNIIKKENEIKIKMTNRIQEQLSIFNLIHSCKVKEKNHLIKYFNRVKSLKESNFINIEYEGDKLPNSKFIFYLNKYLLQLDYFSQSYENNNLNTFTNIIIYDAINDRFIKKIVIEEFYNDFMIKEDNLILIDNIIKLSIINNINYIIESKEKKINLSFINKFIIRINNIERISMVYKWPFININNKYNYYYLIWNSFYYFDTSEINNKLILTNSDILYVSKNQLIKNKLNFKIIKANIDKQYHYINFFINNSDKKIPYFYFFAVNGEIHCYKFNKDNIFKLKKIITNEILYNIQIIKIIPFKNDYNYLIVSNKNDIFNLDLKNQTMTKINFDENKDNKLIKYSMKIFKFIQVYNCIIYDTDEYIKLLSLDDFTIIKKFLYDKYKYNILIISSNDIIII